MSVSHLLRPPGLAILGLIYHPVSWGFRPAGRPPHLTVYVHRVRRLLASQQPATG